MMSESSADRSAERTADATIVLAVFTGLSLVTTLLTLGILKTQLSEMHEGGKDTHTLALATEQMAGASEQNAKAAEQFATAANGIDAGLGRAVEKLNSQVVTSGAIAKIAERQSPISANALEEDRPWVGPRGFTIVYDDAKRLRGVIIPLLNGGRSTAQHVRSSLTFEFGHPEVLNIDPQAPKSKICQAGPLPAEYGDQILLPGAPSDVPVKLHEGMSKRMTEVYSDKLGLFVVGCVDYSYAPGRVRRTSIRERFFPHEDTFALTPDENSAN